MAWAEVLTVPGEPVQECFLYDPVLDLQENHVARLSGIQSQRSTDRLSLGAKR